MNLQLELESSENKPTELQSPRTRPYPSIMNILLSGNELVDYQNTQNNIFETNKHNVFLLVETFIIF